MFYSNKKADEKVLSIYLFIIYIIVIIGIVSGVLLFYQPLDISEAEAGILTDRVIDCLTEKGQLKREIFDKSFDINSFCDFNFEDNTQKYQGKEQYAVKVELYNFENEILVKGSDKIPISGREDFFEVCDSGAFGGKGNPKCNEKSIYVLFGQGKYLLKIKSAVGKTNLNKGI